MPQSRWYPTRDRLGSPAQLAEAFRVLLDQHYALQDRHDALLAKVNAPSSKTAEPPPGSGPTDTMLCGLRVEPVDSRTLANGAVLTWVAKDGRFKFL